MAHGSWNPADGAAAGAGCQTPDGPVPCCNNNCGFLGCAATMNLCSKCYSELILKEGDLFSDKLMVEPSNSTADKSAVRSVDKSMLCTTSSVTAAMEDLHQQIPSPLALSPSISQSIETPLSPLPRQPIETLLSPLPRQQTVNRCLACRKRVGLVGFKCRCGDLFCALHRYSDKHDCSYDYKAAGRTAIAKENPIVKASKIDKI